ncbi:FecR domain-containing protein [Candidatus Omnitrophota bacterium]
MKKLLITLSCAMLFFSMSATSFGQESGLFAKVLSVKGDVLVKGPSDADWVAAVEGMSLEQGATIKTGENSSCEIVLDEDADNIIGIKENSFLDLENKQKINLAKGRIFSLIQIEGDSTFEVHTPTAIGGARGTGWATESKACTTVFKQFEGGIYAVALDESGAPADRTDLSAGYLISVECLTGLGEPLPLTDDDVDEWNTWKQDVSSAGAGDEGLAQKIRDELGEEIDPESGFAADEGDFVFIRPEGGGDTPFVVSSDDITLTEEPPTPDEPGRRLKFESVYFPDEDRYDRGQGESIQTPR